MYLLAHLDEAEKMDKRPYDFSVEYRLVCSGEFYNRRLRAESWRSFEMARLLLLWPFELYVVSQPFNHFPQELCLRFGVNWIMDHQPGGGSTGTAPPYDDLVEDVCAVLTLLSRRLVIPAFEVRTVYGNHGGSRRADSFHADVPSPTIAVGDFSNWGIRVSRAERIGRKVNFLEHRAPPLSVDMGALQNAFLSLSRSQYGKELLQAARAYSSALDLVLPRPELAYQLLVSAVETLASCVCSDVCPSRDEMIEQQSAVAAKARSFGCSGEQAGDLAVEACRKEFWVGKKFKKFLTTFSSEEIYGPDEVFPLAEGWEPNREDLDQVLGAVYNARSKHLHKGKGFPEWISHGATVAVPAAAYQLPRAAEYVPPATWFERLVSSALRCFFARENRLDSEKPFLQT